MNKEANTNWFIRLLGGDDGGKKPKFYVIIILVLTGMGIMIFSSFFDITEQAIPYKSESPITETAGFIDKETTPKTMRDYEKIYENQLTEVISNMLGIEEVVVKVNLDSTEELVAETNKNIAEQHTKEKDNQGGTREITDLNRDEQVVIYRVDSNDKPLILKTLKPKVRGVIVVAKGAEKVQVKALISEAVQRLLGIPPYKIGIYPKLN